MQYHELKDFAHGPAWTRQTMTEQLTLISDYLKTGCGGAGFKLLGDTTLLAPHGQE